MKNTSFQAKNIVKYYGGVVALSDGNLDIRSGEVVALLGANGSGKSTLSKVITGVVSKDGGEMVHDGEIVNFPTPMTARKAGITAVYQELSLIPLMTVAENIWLTHEPLKPGGRVRTQEIESRTKDLLKFFEGTFSTALQPKAEVQNLSADEKQIVEILKAYSQNPKIMILDEATASLDSRQVTRLFELIEDWKEEGMALVFVSHRMDEIFRIADRVMVLRNGRSVGTAEIENVDEADLVAMMVGEERVTITQERDDVPEEFDSPVVLDVKDLNSHALHGIDLVVHEGELLGIGGLRGQGQHGLLLSLFGAIPFKGEITLFGERVSYQHPSEAMKKEVALVPGERSKEGLLMIRSILENLHIPNWKSYGFPLKMKKAIADATRVSDSLNLVRESLEAPVTSLSGGNAQKVVIGKWLLRNPRLLLLDDPTKGVDVGTKTEFYSLLKDLQEEGTTILMYSSDDSELLALCDRIIVMHDGKISAELIGDSITKSNLVGASLGAASMVENNGRGGGKQ